MFLANFYLLLTSSVRIKKFFLSTVLCFSSNFYPDFIPFPPRTQESKPQVKSELYHVMRELMVCSGPMKVIEFLAEDLNHKNAKMREDILIYIIFALLTFPR